MNVTEPATEPRQVPEEETEEIDMSTFLIDADPAFELELPTDPVGGPSYPGD